MSWIALYPEIYTCLNCNGSGCIIKADDTPEEKTRGNWVSIEFYKNTKCSECIGTGINFFDKNIWDYMDKNSDFKAAVERMKVRKR